MNKKKQAIKKIKKLGEITNKKESKDLFKLLAVANGRKYNLRKLSEELNELAGVCLKMSNKKSDTQPPRKEFTDEYGDVLIRMLMIAASQNITVQEISERILYKANKYVGYAKEGKYSKI